ncbi:Beta-phosphoglucomutase [Spironucleus salmonicida]|uniref:Beta-phosphoglucomutase n=1 Tax=Spironucleus salmonicida TaxID=348837 RepID=V6LHB1_9EUKA|nr:Beta-phosphoglucomutase [Spironucleus salmonicida]|eukprot:EST43106.1 Hydrolase, haloacid dehalogenase-like family [Spironucleus salmonicida]
MLEDIKYYVFDFDGTLIDSLATWDIIHEELVKSFNVQYNKEFHFIGMPGLSALDACDLLISKYKLSLTKEQVFKQFAEISISYLKNVKFIHNADKFIEKLIAKNIKFGIATATTRIVIDTIISQFPSIKEKVTIVTCDEVGASKPSPKVFLECMRQIGGNPQETVVFEDTVAGMQGARASGGRVIGILSERNQMDQKREICDFLVDDYTELLKEL